MRRRTILKSSALVALGAATTAALGSCNQTTSDSPETSSDSASTSKLRVALVPWLGWGETKIAEVKGFVEEEGIEIGQTVIQSVPEVSSAFLAGQMDMAWLT